MKHIIFLFTILISSCTTYKTYSAGKEDISYVVVLSEGDTYQDIGIKINDTTTTIKKVFKKNKLMKSTFIKVIPGLHTIEVLHQGKVLFSQKIYVGVQETKKIMLP